MKVRTSPTSGKDFARRDITIPSEALQELGWPDGIELSWHVDGDVLKLRPAKSRRPPRAS